MTMTMKIRRMFITIIMIIIGMIMILVIVLMKQEHMYINNDDVEVITAVIMKILGVSLIFLVTVMMLTLFIVAIMIGKIIILI